MATKAPRPRVSKCTQGCLSPKRWVVRCSGGEFEQICVFILAPGSPGQENKIHSLPEVVLPEGTPQGHTPPYPQQRNKTAQCWSLQLEPSAISDLPKARISTLAHLTPTLLVRWQKILAGPSSPVPIAWLVPSLELGLCSYSPPTLFCWVLGLPSPKRHRATQDEGGGEWCLGRWVSESWRL